MNSPTLFNPKTIGQFYDPNITEYTRLGIISGLTPASSDIVKNLVIPVDIQNDFHLDWGTLKINGALDDLVRFLTWFYKNCGRITTIMPTFDTHVRYQIFFAEAWINTQTGKHPNPYDTILAADILAGKWECLYGYDWALYYTQTLEAKGRVLTIWPLHTMLGSDGQKLVSQLAEAIAYFEAARDTKSIPDIKGLYPKSEHYGAYGPEVLDKFVFLDTDRLEMVNTYNRIVYVGQADDFCLLTTIQQHVDYLIATNCHEDIKKIYILMDCTSPVIKTPVEEYTKLQTLGVNLTDSLSFAL